MAPEQALGERKIDARADVFAPGCVLYKCLTGEAAFTGNNLYTILAKIVLEQAPRLDAGAPDAPAPLVDLLAQMLSKEKSERPADGAAVAEALRAIGAVPSLRRSRRQDAPPSLTTGEQRILTIVLGRMRWPAATSDAAAHASVPADEALRATLRAALAGSGAQLNVLADGSVLCTLTGAALADQAARAARCALSLRTVVRGAAQIAVTTGRGRTGEGWHTGDVINRAATVIETLPAGAIGVDALTASVVDARFELRVHDNVQLLVRERSRGEERRTLLGRPTPCVGRDRELVTLDAVWDECVADALGHIVLVTAPPGTGKTRLVQEVVERVRARRVGQIWQGRADSVAAGAPLWLLADALRRTVGVQAGEPLERRREKIAARVARHVPPEQRERTAAFLGELMGTSFGPGVSTAGTTMGHDARLIADQMRLAWEDFVIR